MVTFSVPTHGSNSECESCGCEITYSDFLITKDLGYSVCRSFDCVRMMKQKSSMSPLLFKSQLEFNKKLNRQNRERDAAKKTHIESVRKKEHLEDQFLFQSVLSKHSELSGDNTYLLVIPSGNAETVVSSGKRINKYTEHLSRIINDATAYSNASEVASDEHHNAYVKKLQTDQLIDASPLLRTVSDQLCGLCKGGCCACGNDHAYLSVFTIRRFMDDNPGFTPEQILDLYLTGISSESIDDSCINHTETGCMLPRHLRSDICNGYYCDPLKSYQEKTAGRESSQRIIVIQRSSTYWNRYESGVVNDIVSVSLVDEEIVCDLSLHALSRAAQ